MNLFDEQGINYGGGAKGFRVYDDLGHLVGPSTGSGPPGPPGAPGTDGADGVSIQWLGTFSSAPGSPTLNQAYRDSTALKSFIWDGATWQEMNEDGAPGSPGSPGANGGTSYIKVASSSSRTIATGSVSFVFTSPIVVPDSLGWDISTRVRAISAANPANFMDGAITAINMALLPTRVVSVTVLVDLVGGSGTFSDFVLSATGFTGATGPAGPGVPTGGIAGQVLTKNSSTDYDDSWQTPASGADVLQVQVFS